MTRTQITIYRTEEVGQFVILINRGMEDSKEVEVIWLSGFLGIIDMGFITQGGT